MAPAPKLPKEHAAAAPEAVSVAQPAPTPIETPVAERESSPALLDVPVQQTPHEIASDTVLTAGAPDEPNP